jgi:propionyl-CoA carboxylase beta chain
MDKKIEELQRRLKLAWEGGGPKRIERQHSQKKLTARERIGYLLDEGSFEEMGALVTHRTTDFGMASQKYYGDGVVTGYMSMPRTSRFSVAPYRKPMLKKSVR